MARRQTEVLRNLDTPLRIAGVISVRGCGVVLFYFVCTQALDTIGFWDVITGLTVGKMWSWVVQNGSVALLAAVMIIIERHEDEFLVPQAIQYFVSQYLNVQATRGDNLVSDTLRTIFSIPRSLSEVIAGVLGRRRVVYTGLANQHHKPHPIEGILNE
jgi:hypothetical protein